MISNGENTSIVRIFAIQLDTFRISSCTVCFITDKSSIWFFVPPNKSLNVSKADVNIFL